MKEESFNLWIGLRASDYQMFNDLIEIHQIVSVDTDETKGIPLISREALTKHRGSWSNDELLTVSEVEEFQVLCEKIKTVKATVNIYGYHSFPLIEKLASEYNHIIVHSSSAALRDRLDDKLQFMDVLNKLELLKIPSFSESISNLNFHEIADKMGLPLVLKLKVGASGGQTYFVSTHDDFIKLQQVLKNDTVIVSEYVSGPSFNINGFIGTENVYLDQPSLQIIGVPECSSGRFTYCGNDFPGFRKHHEALTDEVKHVAQKLGCYMKDLGYYGFFGIDFIYNVRNKVLYALEINPRMQGSTALLARYQLAKKAPRLVELYTSETKSFDHPEPVDASFILLHNLGTKPLTIENSFASGIYTFGLSQGKLQPTYIGDTKIFPTQKNELLVLGCPPKGTLIEPGAGIMRIEFGSAILKKNGTQLKKFYSTIAHDLYNRLWKEK